jgi:DNA repair exonuclease SbcCD nuclease subunit
MSILCIGDLHIQKRNLNLFAQFQDKLFSFIKSTPGIGTIVILGDVLHTMNIINTHCLNAAIQFFKQLDVLDIKIMILVGNHDYIGPNEYLTKNHWMNAISEFNPKNITIVDTIITHGENVYMPYVPTGRFNDALSTVDLQNVKYIFCHQEFLGARYEFGNVVSDHGDIWDNKPIVVSGHIHKRQWLNKNIYYTGTPYQTRFNEEPDKTIALIKDNTINEFSLDLPKMITLYKTISDLKKLQFDSNHLYKIILKVDNQTQTQNFLKTDLYKLVRKSATIIFEYPKNEQIATVKANEPPNFKTILYNKIKGNKNMEYIFNKCLKV